MNIKRFIVICIVFALPAGVTHCAYGALPSPCIDTDANYHAASDVISADGACKVWFCSANHLWNLYYICGTWSEITGATLNHIMGVKQSSQAVRDSEWIAISTTPPAAGSADERLAKLALAAPTPIDAPIDGLVTQTTTIYKQQLAVGGYSMVAVGTIALGKPCNASVSLSDATGLYYAVARADVVMKKIGKYTPPFPSTAYGKCT